MKKINEIREEDILAHCDNAMLIKYNDESYPVVFLTYNMFTDEIESSVGLTKEICAKIAKSLRES